MNSFMPGLKGVSKHENNEQVKNLIERIRKRHKRSVITENLILLFIEM